MSNSFPCYFYSILKKYLSLVSSFWSRVVLVSLLLHLSVCFIFMTYFTSYCVRYKLKGSWNVCTRSVCKVRGLTLLLRAGTLWRCGDGLFFEVPPLASDALLQRSNHFSKTCCRLLITSKYLATELPFHGCKSPDLDCMADVLMGFHLSTFSKPNTEFNSDLAPCDFWVFPTMKRELRGKKFRSDQRSAARFREVGGAL
jgi:hypothetical protein